MKILSFLYVYYFSNLLNKVINWTVHNVNSITKHQSFSFIVFKFLCILNHNQFCATLPLRSLGCKCWIQVMWKEVAVVVQVNLWHKQRTARRGNPWHLLAVRRLLFWHDSYKYRPLVCTQWICRKCCITERQTKSFHTVFYKRCLYYNSEMVSIISFDRCCSETKLKKTDHTTRTQARWW